MNKIHKLVFKIHRKLFGYPMRSEIRLAFNDPSFGMLSLESTVALVYICGESIEDVSEWLNIEEVEIKSILNKIGGRL